MRHPETEATEVFISNVSMKTFQSLPYASKRLGTTTFDGEGRQFAVPDWRPFFLSTAEISATDVIALARKIRVLEGLA